MKKKILSLLLICFSFQFLYAQVIDYYDKTVENLYRSYIQIGRMPPFYYGPVLAGQVNTAANKISSPYYISNADRNGATFSGFTNLGGNLFSKEESIEKIGRGEANNGIDFAKNYLSKPSFLAFAADFSSSIGLGGGTQVDFRSTFLNDYFEPFTITDDMDPNLLGKAYIYFDNPYVSLLIGRINAQMGLLYSDPLFFNNAIPYIDSVRLVIPFGRYFNLHWQMTNIPAVQSVYQKDVKTGNDFKDEYEESLTNPNFTGLYQDYFYGFEDDDFPSLILNMYQRFGFQNDFMQAGLSFNVFLARRNNRFEFADLFPFAEWHSTDVIPNNMSLGLDLAIVPTKNLLFNVQLGFDEVDAQVFGISDSTIPTIWSIIGTMQNTLLTKQINILFSTNTGYTHYLWGNFSGTSVRDTANAALGKALYRYNGKNPMYLPYTSPYGPGAIWFSQQAIIHFNTNSYLAGLRVAPKVSLLLKDLDVNLIDTAYERRTGDVAQMVYFSFDLPVAYAWRTLEAAITPSVHVKGLGVPTVTWFEFTFSVKASFSASIFEKNKKAAFEFNY